jgi:hypothetical protein
MISLKTIKRSTLAGSLASLGMATKAFAQNAKETINKDVASINPSLSTNLTASVKNIINVLIGVIGVVAVIMLIIGAFQFVVSSGNADSTKKAKDTILFAVIGIVVALLSFAIVNFVLSNFKG